MIQSFCALGVAAIVIGCGAGLPEEDPAPAPNPVQNVVQQGCSLTGTNLDFNVRNLGSTLFWAIDPQLELPRDRAKAKLLFEIPDNQLPSGVDFADIRIAPVPDGNLPQGRHIDTAFRISAIAPPGLSGFTGGGVLPLTLTIRYDPIACDIAPETEADLVLGRLLASGEWTAVCGDKANVAAHDVSCDQGDLSFGIFAVIPKGTGISNDTTPPVFPTRGAISLAGTPCYTCDPRHIILEWGPASDGGGSGINGYRIYVDGNRDAFVAQNTLTGNPIKYLFTPTGSVDILQPHLYQITAVDKADNESARYGALCLPRCPP